LIFAARRIIVAVEVPTMAKPLKNTQRDAERLARIEKLLELLEEELRDRLGDDSTFEERNDAAVDVVTDVLWRREDADLRGSITTADEVEV
jgi:hypothetical protein